MPRFVLLLHECPHDRPLPTHCDLMLEVGETLPTWALATVPRDWDCLQGVNFAVSNTVAADELAHHRLAYLDYEGPLSGNRGSVKRLDFGTYVTHQRTPDRWVLDIIGQVISGEIELQRTPNDSSVWQLTYRPLAPLAV